MVLKKRKVPIRGLFEIVGVVVIVIFATVSLRSQAERTVEMKLENGALVYHGKLANHKFSGIGTLKFKNGDHYVGSFYDGRFAKQGKYVSHDGWLYQGGFNKGVPSGEGQIKDGTKVLYRGNFKDGKLSNEN